MVCLHLHPPLHLPDHLTQSQRVAAVHCGPVLTQAALWINIKHETSNVFELVRFTPWFSNRLKTYLRNDHATLCVHSKMFSQTTQILISHRLPCFCFWVVSSCGDVHSPLFYTVPSSQLAWQKWILAAEACTDTRRTGGLDSGPDSRAPEPREHLQA